MSEQQQSCAAIMAAANIILERLKHNVKTAKNDVWRFNAKMTVACLNVWYCEDAENNSKFLVEFRDADCQVLNLILESQLTEMDRFSELNIEVRSEW